VTPDAHSGPEWIAPDTWGKPLARAVTYPPGVWTDEDGALHFDIEAMVRGAGYEPTPENMGAMTKAAHDMAARVGANVETVLHPGAPAEPNHVAACWELRTGWCASLANGRARCRKGKCYLLTELGEP
jgi:hypothetical protein